VTEDGRQRVRRSLGEAGRTEDKMGRAENQGNRVQASRITGNQDTLQMVRGFAPYGLRSALHYINYFWERIYADAPRAFHLDLFNPRNSRLQITGKSVNHFDWIKQNKANLPAGQNSGKLSFDKGL